MYMGISRLDKYRLLCLSLSRFWIGLNECWDLSMTWNCQIWPMKFISVCYTCPYTSWAHYLDPDQPVQVELSDHDPRYFLLSVTIFISLLQQYIIYKLAYCSNHYNINLKEHLLWANILVLLYVENRNVV